jgi:hypothetical protein
VKGTTWALVVVLAAGAPTLAGAESLRQTLGTASRTVGINGGSAFDALANAIADTAARSLPVVSASAGFTYEYNPELEVFERSSSTLGPLFLERPDTIGRGKVNVNVSYQYVQFDTFDGNNIDSLHSPFPILLSGGSAANLEYRLGLHSHIVGLSATYGVLDDFDVNLLVPLIQTNFDVGVHTGGAHGHVSNDHFGVGDVLARLKYRLPDQGRFRSALGLQLRFPSGSKANFQGTGEFEASPSFYVSTLVWDHLHPHLNAAVDIRPGEIDRSQARYGVGLDADVLTRLGLSLAFLGRSEFSRSAKFSDTAFLHQTPTGARPEPLLGLNFGRKDYFDVALGARVVVWREIMVFANVTRRLNNDGLRNDTVIPAVGVEGTF